MIYIILGRFGDLFMVCKAIKGPAIIICSKEFSAIVKEMFPEFEVDEVDFPKNDLSSTYNYAKFKYPNRSIVIAQQDGTKKELMLPFRNYQKFQEYYATQGGNMS